MYVQVARPQPPSRLGRGNFPERELARAAEAEQYYPGLPSIATLGETSLHSWCVKIISECARYRGPELHLQPAVHHHRGGDRGAAAQLQPRGGLRLLLPAEEEALDQDEGGGGAAAAPEAGGAAAAAPAPPAGSRGSRCHVPRSLRQDQWQVLQFQVSSSVNSNHRHHCHCTIFYVLSQFLAIFSLFHGLSC